MFFVFLPKHHYPSPREGPIYLILFLYITFQILLQSHLKPESLGLIKFERLIVKWLRLPGFKPWSHFLLVV